MAMNKPIPAPAVRKPVPQPLQKRTVHVTSPVDADIEVDDGQEEFDEFSPAQSEEVQEGGEFQEESEEVQQEEPEVEVVPPTPPARGRGRPPNPNRTLPPNTNGKAATPVNARPVSQPKVEQALAPRQKAQVAVDAPPAVHSNALKGDLLIPRVLLMQSMSQLVKDRKAFPGQIVRSPSGERLGGIINPGEPAETIDVIPLSMSTSWTIQATEGNKWLGSEPRTAENDSLPWEFTNEDGEDCKRLKTIDMVGLLPADIVKSLDGVTTDDDGVPDDLDAAVLLPVAFSFRSTSFTAGKGVSTFFAKVEAATKQHPRTRPYHFTLAIGCIEDANDHGEYFVFEVGGTKKTDKDLCPSAAQWFEQIQRSSVKIEDEAEAEAKAASNLKARPKGKQQF